MNKLRLCLMVLGLSPAMAFAQPYELINQHLDAITASGSVTIMVSSRSTSNVTVHTTSNNRKSKVLVQQNVNGMLTTKEILADGVTDIAITNSNAKISSNTKTRLSKKKRISVKSESTSSSGVTYSSSAIVNMREFFNKDLR